MVIFVSISLDDNWMKELITLPLEHPCWVVNNCIVIYGYRIFLSDRSVLSDS